jgi:aspartyl-tRNA(Asn)/glutamyl-tRNA(Gln) amidotransferase subunit C
MPISREQVEHVAVLARLTLTEDEKDKLTTELGQILEYADKIAELDTATVKPSAHAVYVTNVFRADQVGTELSRDEALANAPDREDDAFGVPKII